MAIISGAFIVGLRNQIKEENRKMDKKENKKTLYKDDIRSPWRVL